MTTAELGFHWVPLPEPLPGQLVYVARDYAIDFVIEPEIQGSEQAFWDGGCSISLQTLEIYAACQSHRSWARKATPRERRIYEQQQETSG